MKRNWTITFRRNLDREGELSVRVVPDEIARGILLIIDWIVKRAGYNGVVFRGTWVGPRTYVRCGPGETFAIVGFPHQTIQVEQGDGVIVYEIEAGFGRIDPVLGHWLAMCWMKEDKLAESEVL